MDVKNLTPDACWDLVGLASERWQCGDDPEDKALCLACNDLVSPEAAQLHRDALIIDACAFNVVHYGWRLQAAGATAINCTVPGVFDNAGDAFRAMVSHYGVAGSDPRFRLILTPEDILEAKKAHQTGLILGAQGCNFVQAFNLEPMIQAFSRLGLRVMQIGYNYRSFVSGGCFDPTNPGLSEYAPGLIRLMERYGITVDLSHVGERSTLEAMDLAEKPQIFSHSNPKALFDHARNITDEQAKKCAATGGVIGVTGYNIMLWDGKRFPDADRFVDAICYFCDLVGVDHVGVGMDSTATEGCYPREEVHYFAKLSRLTSGDNDPGYQSIRAGRPLALAASTEGLMCLANWVCLFDKLLKRGFTPQEVRKIAGENWLRVFRETWI